MPGRKFVSGEDYRFGFNGKEDDRDWGTQNIQDYGFRLYNPSIGKFLSVDPLSPDYPWYTPYQFAGNKPIWAVDLDGLEESMATLAQQRAQEAYLRQEISENELRDVYEAQALGAAAGGTIVAAGYAAVVAAPRMIMWGMRNPFVIKEVGAFGYGLLDQTGTDVPATVGDDLGHTVAGVFSLSKLRLGGFNPLSEVGVDGYRLFAKSVSPNSRSIMGTKITKSGIQNIEKHLSNPFFTKSTGNEIAPGNAYMINRLNKILKGEIEETTTDLFFYTHELREKELMNGVYKLETYEKSHAIAAKEYGVKGKDEDSTFYTYEALKIMWGL